MKKCCFLSSLFNQGRFLLGVILIALTACSSGGGSDASIASSTSSNNNINTLSVDKNSQVATPASVYLFSSSTNKLSVDDTSGNDSVSLVSQSNGSKYTSTIVSSSDYYSAATISFTIKNSSSSPIAINDLIANLTNLSVNGGSLSANGVSIRSDIGQDSVNNSPYFTIMQTVSGNDVSLDISTPTCTSYCDWAMLGANNTKTITLNLSRNNGPINSVTVGDITLSNGNNPPPVQESGALDLMVDTSALKSLCTSSSCNIKVTVVPPSGQNSLVLNVNPTTTPKYEVDYQGLLIGTYSVVVDNSTYPDSKGGQISYTLTPTVVQVNSNNTTHATLQFAYKPATPTGSLVIKTSAISGNTFSNVGKLLGTLVAADGTSKTFSVGINDSTVISGLNYGGYIIKLQGVADPASGIYYTVADTAVDVENSSTTQSLSFTQVASSQLHPVSFNITNLPTTTESVAFAAQNSNYLYNQDILATKNYYFLNSESAVAVTLYQHSGYTLTYSPSTITPTTTEEVINYTKNTINYLTTKNGNIVDSNGNVVKLKGINWFGFQGTGDQMVDGLYSSSDGISGDFITHVKRLKALGFNAVRLPFGFDVINGSLTRNYTMNYCTIASDSVLQTNLTNPAYTPATGASIPTLSYIPTQTPNVCNAYLPNDTVMNRFIFVINTFAQNGFYVLLDDHLNGSGDYTLVKSGATAWTNDWKNLAAQLSTNLSATSQSMIMFDLLNEPDFQQIKWDATVTVNGNVIPKLGDLYTGAIDAIYPYFSHNLFFVEGTGQGTLGANWGDGFATDAASIAAGNSNPNQFFTTLAGKEYQSQVVLSPHVYPPSVTYATSNYSGSGLYNRLSKSFGYLNKTGYCINGNCHQYPVAIGEFGSRFAASGDFDFLRDFASYLNNANDAVDGLHNAVDNWFYWSWNPNSGDTGGVLEDNWLDISWTRINYLTNGVVNGNSVNANGLNLKPWYFK